ncbi:DoxX family membrane protein [Streptomyces sp. NPDC018000]|uniref:DoxX family membrane protein n=1 Tax=Streptomyces sp. NPDC018000 TaxID=3365028 RepID=UPI0037B7E34A
MSVDTRTPRFDELPALSMAKVDCDPAQVIVNHASFRVRLAPGQRPRLRGPAPAGAPRIPAMSSAAGTVRGRRSPVVWSGRSAPGDPGATGLLQAVRNSTAGRPTPAYDPYDYDPYAGHEFGGGPGAGGTQVIERLEETRPNPVITAPQQPGRHGNGPLLPPMRRAVGAYDSVDPGPYGQEVYGEGDFGEGGFGEDEYDDFAEGRGRRHGGDTVRHAYYPGRRMNLGVVLLPMRVFLGFISIYAGMGKLCDPVYFDGGERGSMVKWLSSLHPWGLAEPLRDFALSHPVGAGLTVAFLQVVVGVLTVLGLWQRVAASVGALLSAALLVTVTWRTVAVYDAPDIIYLAAWSPLIIAGAPVYSVDGRLSGEAWRRLGPRSAIWDLRRRVLGRGAVVAAVVVGLTLLVGSMLGGAVRSSQVVTVPGHGDPTNQLPGSPLPQESRSGRASHTPDGRRPSPSRSSASTTPSATASTPAADAVRESGQAVAGAGQPSQTQGTAQQPQQTTPQQPPSSSSGPSSSGFTGTGGGSSGSGSTGGGSDSGGSTGGTSGGGQGAIGGLLG